MALLGRAIVVLTSLRFGAIVAWALLLAKLVSGTVLVPATAVTVAPAGPTKTLIGKVAVPLAGTLWLVVVDTPLTVTTEVKVVGTPVLLV